VLAPELFGLAGKPGSHLDDFRQEAVGTFHLSDVGVERHPESGQARFYTVQPVFG
jgi:hypothetical protein